jgi:hypothetical protein
MKTFLLVLLAAALPGILLYFHGVYRWKDWLWFREKKSK